MRWVYRLSTIATVSQRQTGLRSWIVALVIFLATLAFHWALRDVLTGVRFLTFFPAIVSTAVIAGWRPAAGVLILSALAGWYFWLAYAKSFPLAPQTAIISSLFLVAGGLIIVAIEGFRQLLQLNMIQQKKLSDLVRRQDDLVRRQETMFREMQHRVANHMQFISSMLAISRGRIQSGEAAQQIFDQAIVRVSTMAKLHRKLHDPTVYTQGVQPVLQEVLNDMFTGLPVVVRTQVSATDLSPDRMATIVMLVTEAATNAIKHVFQAELGSLFEVELRDQPNERAVLVVRDNGPGISLDVENPGTPRGSGIRIMRGLALQLGGRLRFDNRGGTTIMVEFPRV